MKQKLTLLLIALFTAMGAWADGLKVSTTASASAEYQYKIFCRNASDYYLGNTTNATNSGADYGLFAFFADDSGDYTNGYYIYSIFEGKWVTYTPAASYSEGKNKISLVADKPSVPWNIAADNSDNKYYDIRAFITDKTVASMSWNWHGGAANNTSNTMGFYGYTDGNSGWGIVLAGGSGSTVADRKVVALYNVPSDNNQYALYNSSGTPKVYSATTGVTPQYFVLRQNGLDTNGEALYRLQKAEMDGKYLHYQDFNTDGYNYMFLNTSSYYHSKFTITTSNQPEWAVSPYYNLYRVYPNATDNNSRPYANQVSKCDDKVVDMYSGPSNNIPAQLTEKGSWNGRWQVVEQSYTAWQVVILGTTSGTITYGGSALISGGTTTQSNNGIFVLNATPTISNFTASTVDGYCTDPTITIDNNRKIIKVVYTDYTEVVNFLSNTPEGVGYPTSAARTTFQSAIDVFTASSKTSSDLSTLRTAKSVFEGAAINLPEVGKVYTIQSYVKSSSTTAYIENVGGTFTISTTASETALENLWIVCSSSDKITLQSAADRTKYIIFANPCLGATGSEWTPSKGTAWPYIALYNAALGGGRYLASNASTEFGQLSGKYYSDAVKQASGWSTDFKFVESTEYKLVTYNLKWNENTIATKEGELAQIGAAPVSPWDVPAYCNFTYDVATIESSTTVVNVTMNWTGPFDFSTDYASAIWYYLALNEKWAKNKEWKSPNLYEDITDVKEINEGLWAFLGNPYDGIILMLKEQYLGWEMFLSASVGNPAFTYVANATERWKVGIRSSSTFTLSCGTKYITENTLENRMDNFQDGITESTAGVFSVRSYYCQRALDNWATYVGESTDKLFGVRPACVTSIENTILGMPKMTETEYNSYFATIPNANITGFISYNQPTSGHYYRIKNNSTGNYLAYGTPTTSEGGNRPVGLIATSTSNDAASVIKLTGSAGTYKISTQGLNIQGQRDANVAFPGSGEEGVDFVFNIATPGVVSITNAASAVSNTQRDGSLHEATSGWGVHGVVNWDASVANSKWVVEDATEITLTLNAVGDNTYGTTYLPFDVTLPGEGDVCAYTLTDLNNGWVRPVLLGTDGKSIPADTPVLLRGTSSTSVTATIADVDAIDIDENVLAGTCLSMAHGDNLVLGKYEGVVGFYKYNFDIKPNKAYIPAGTNVKGFMLSFEDDADAIKTIDCGQQPTDEAIYNLAGQRISKVQKGINIVNGKKILK